MIGITEMKQIKNGGKCKINYISNAKILFLYMNISKYFPLPSVINTYMY